jgi:tetratricopeptide (TPR) repeat protein
VLGCGSKEIIMSGRPLRLQGRLRLACVVALAVPAALLSLGAAADKDLQTWVGKRVVQKSADFALWNGKEAVDRKKMVEIYHVEQAKDPWLWLQGPTLSGWAKATDVLAVDEAIDFFTKAIHDKPTDPFGFAMRATLWYDKGDFEQVITDENDVIRLDPKDAAAFATRGDAWRAKRDYDRALADYDAAIELDPTLATAYFSRAMVWTARKDLDRAINDYDDAIRLDPNDVTAYNNRGAAWLAKKNFDKALEDFSQAIRLDPNYARAFNNRGDAFYAKKDYEHALDDFNTAIKLDPKDASSFAMRAWIWATCPDPKLRDGKKAVESATRSCDLTQWKDFLKLDTLAAAAAETHDFDAAVKWQTKAIDLAPAPWQVRLRALLKLYQAKQAYHEVGSR